MAISKDSFTDFVPRGGSFSSKIFPVSELIHGDFAEHTMLVLKKLYSLGFLGFSSPLKANLDVKGSKSFQNFLTKFSLFDFPLEIRSSSWFIFSVNL